MNVSMIMSIVVTMIGFVYSLSAFLLPNAKIGLPYEPKIFPAILGIALLVLGTILIIQEIKERARAVDKTEHAVFFGREQKDIVLTLCNGFVYALLFDRIGYVFATIIFLNFQLFVFRGVKAWKNSALVSVIFSVVAFILFNSLMGVYLPKSPLGFV
ncbi:tripartite tricarboxylate transporter TctB family protein [uncultured Sphaerochaeta sp.]|uniref:tripartite tricarboxylate transporter TctB family protein n=1 Tax=uncultured Sphaerochaeta sp. TaxID=886478 RepID=UPI002A0A5F05|nr:tripartite tricarboxylate transporter TctB family protein [uncultured Sphaerochaeta sp.]